MPESTVIAIDPLDVPQPASPVPISTISNPPVMLTVATIEDSHRSASVT